MARCKYKCINGLTNGINKFHGFTTWILNIMIHTQLWFRKSSQAKVGNHVRETIAHYSLYSFSEMIWPFSEIETEAKLI